MGLPAIGVMAGDSSPKAHFQGRRSLGSKADIGQKVPVAVGMMVVIMAPGMEGASETRCPSGILIQEAGKLQCLQWLDPLL